MVSRVWRELCVAGFWNRLRHPAVNSVPSVWALACGSDFQLEIERVKFWRVWAIEMPEDYHRYRSQIGAL